MDSAVEFFSMHSVHFAFPGTLEFCMSLLKKDKTASFSFNVHGRLITLHAAFPATDFCAFLVAEDCAFTATDDCIFLTTEDCDFPATNLKKLKQE